MKLPDDDRNRCMTEQCWLGVGIMLFWAVAIMILFKACALGASLTVVWNPAPEGETVTHWNLYRTFPEPRLLLTTATTPQATIEVNEGDHVVVTANNDGIESADSLPLIVRLPKPNPIARVTVQTSSDMETWTDFSSVDMPESIARFFRLKIEKP